MNKLVPSSRAEAPLTLTVDPSGGLSLSDGTASTGDLWRILWRRKGLIAATACALLAVALVYGIVTPPLYTASAEIIIDPRDRQVMANDVNPTGAAPDGGIMQVESQVQVIQSSTVLLRAINATDLTHDPDFNKPATLDWLIRLWRGTPEAPQSPAAAEARTLRTLRSRIAVTRAEKVFVIGVYVTAISADKAATVANAIADAYLTDQAEAKAQNGRAAAAALTARLEEQRARVEALDNEIQTYSKSNNILMVNGNFVGDQKLIDFTAQLTAAQTRTASLRAKIDQLHQPNVSAASTPEAMQSPVIAKLREQEGTLVQKQAEMETRLGPQYPTVPSVRAQVASIKELITAELNRIANTMQGEYLRALTDERLLSAEVDRAKAENLAVRQASVRLRELQRDLEASRTVYAAFLTRAREMHEQVGVDATNVRIITRATPPLQKSWPPLALLVMGAIGSGVGLGSGLALIREYVSPTMLSRDQVERSVGAPVIGILPGTAVTGRRRIAHPASLGTNASPNVLAIMGLALRRLFDTDSSRRESIGLRSLVVTSGAQDADARQEVCSLFATAATLRGDRVLLVDADVAGGYPGVAAGLRDVLHGDCTLESLVDIASPTGVAYLGKGRDQHSALLYRSWGGVMRMLADARQHFDIVIIDGGVVAENLQVAPLLTVADEVLFVGQLAKTSQNDLNRAADAATIMGRPISAIILVDPTEQA